LLLVVAVVVPKEVAAVEGAVFFKGMRVLYPALLIL
jgi:hypothetical protein